jgi:hypothetical protein
MVKPGAVSGVFQAVNFIIYTLYQPGNKYNGIINF